MTDLSQIDTATLLNLYKKAQSVQPKSNTALAAKPTEDQGKSQGYAKLMSTGERQYDEAVKDGYNPAGPVNAFARGIEDVPLINGLAPILRNDAADRGRAAERLFQDAALKAATGAGQSKPEMIENPRTYFRGWGEGESTAANKRVARQTAFDSAKTRAGPLGTDIEDPYVDPRAPGWSIQRKNQEAALKGGKARVGGGAGSKAPRLSPAEAAKLPSGAKFIGEDGVERTRN